MYDHVELLQTNVTVGKSTLQYDWVSSFASVNAEKHFRNLMFVCFIPGRIHMHHISNAAMLTGMSIELCTPYPRHILMSLQMPPITFVSRYMFFLNYEVCFMGYFKHFPPRQLQIPSQKIPMTNIYPSISGSACLKVLSTNFLKIVQNMVIALCLKF